MPKMLGYQHVTTCPWCGDRRTRGVHKEKEKTFAGCPSCGYKGALNDSSRAVVTQPTDKREKN